MYLEAPAGLIFGSPADPVCCRLRLSQSIPGLCNFGCPKNGSRKGLSSTWYIWANNNLSALFARDLLVPIVHETTYEALRDVSPLLGSRSGLSTSENSKADVAAKLAELVSI